MLKIPKECKYVLKIEPERSLAEEKQVRAELRSRGEYSNLVFVRKGSKRKVLPLIFVAFDDERSFMAYKRALEHNPFISATYVKVSRVTSQEANNIEQRSKTKLYVGNLTMRTKNLDLWNYFKKFGRLAYAYVIKEPRSKQASKGFGFVIFENRESVDKTLAVEVHVLDGNELIVKPFLNKSQIKRLKKGSTGKLKGTTKGAQKRGQDLEYAQRSGEGLQRRPQNWNTRFYEEIKQDFPEYYGDGDDEAYRGDEYSDYYDYDYRSERDQQQKRRRFYSHLESSRSPGNQLEGSDYRYPEDFLERSGGPWRKIKGSKTIFSRNQPGHCFSQKRGQSQNQQFSDPFNSSNFDEFEQFEKQKKPSGYQNPPEQDEIDSINLEESSLITHRRRAWDVSGKNRRHRFQEFSDWQKRDESHRLQRLGSEGPKILGCPAKFISSNPNLTKHQPQSQKDRRHQQTSNFLEEPRFLNSNYGGMNKKSRKRWSEYGESPFDHLNRDEGPEGHSSGHLISQSESSQPEFFFDSSSYKNTNQLGQIQIPNRCSPNDFSSTSIKDHQVELYRDSSSQQPVVFESPQKTVPFNQPGKRSFAFGHNLSETINKKSSADKNNLPFRFEYDDDDYQPDKHGRRDPGQQQHIYSREEQESFWVGFQNYQKKSQLPQFTRKDQVNQIAGTRQKFDLNSQIGKEKHKSDYDFPGTLQGNMNHDQNPIGIPIHNLAYGVGANSTVRRDKEARDRQFNINRSPDFESLQRNEEPGDYSLDQIHRIRSEGEFLNQAAQLLPEEAIHHRNFDSDLQIAIDQGRYSANNNQYRHLLERDQHFSQNLNLEPSQQQGSPSILYDLQEPQEVRDLEQTRNHQNLPEFIPEGQLRRNRRFQPNLDFSTSEGGQRTLSKIIKKSKKSRKMNWHRAPDTEKNWYIGIIEKGTGIPQGSISGQDLNLRLNYIIEQPETSRRPKTRKNSFQDHFE